MALLETDNCWPGNGWEGEGSENPAGWRYFSGTGQGGLGPRRPMPEGTVYAEFDGYWDDTSGGSRWLRVGLACVNSTYVWDPNGYSIMIETDTGALSVPSGWGLGAFVVGSDKSVKMGMHHMPDFAFTVGIGIDDNGDMLVYYGGQLAYRLTGNTAPKGTYALATAYNYAGGHYNEVRFYDALPDVVPPAPLPPLLEVDNCWPGRGWVDGDESPAGWRYFAGNGQGSVGPRRPPPEGTIYAEWDFYWDAFGGDNWLRLGLWTPVIYNWDPGGYSVKIHTDDGRLELPSSWYPNGTYLVGSPGSAVLGARRTPGTAATVGIGIIDGDTAVYVDRELVYRVTGITDLPLGPWALASAYNYGGGHYNEVRFYSVLPGEEPPVRTVPHALLQADVNTVLAPSYLQSDVRITRPSLVPVSEAFIQADAVGMATIYPTSIQVDVRVTGLETGGSGNLPIGTASP